MLCQWGCRDCVQVLAICSVQVPAGRQINFESLALASQAILRQNMSDHAICQLWLPFPLNNSNILGKGIIIPLISSYLDDIMMLHVLSMAAGQIILWVWHYREEEMFVAFTRLGHKSSQSRFLSMAQVIQIRPSEFCMYPSNGTVFQNLNRCKASAKSESADAFQN